MGWTRSRTRSCAVAAALGWSVVGCGGSQNQVASPSASPTEDFTEAEAGEDEDPAEALGASDEEETSDEEAVTPAGNSSGSGETAQPVPEDVEPGAGECRDNTAPLSLTVDRKHVDLAKGTLEAQMDGHICNISLTIERKNDLPSVVKRFRYTGPKRALHWTPIPRDDITRIEVRLDSDDGAYESVFLIPWFVTIDHEEVVFDTNQAVIRPSEVQSLEASLAKINEVLTEGKEMGLGTITLFIAGHTDTQGSDQHNMTLSRNRALAIANWFKRAGVCVPIAFEGFGETALKKVTADEVDEEENRRVDYILSVEPPVIREGGSPAWQWVSKGC